jgi:ATP-dependent Lon protease
MAKRPSNPEEQPERQPEAGDRRVLPLVALRETVIFPEMIVPLQVGREKSVAALNAAVESGGPIALVTQRQPEQEEISSPAELYEVGTLAKIAQVVQLQDGTVRAIIQGQTRIRVLGFVQTSPYLGVEVEELRDEAPTGVEAQALVRSVQAQMEQYVANGAPVPPEAAVAARNITEPGLLADMVAYSPDMTTEQRQELLETIDVEQRLKLVSAFLARQIEILELKGKIQSEVKSEMDKTQREYILREQLKAIQRELGEDDPQQAEINELREKVEQSGMPEEVRTRAIKEIDRMSRIPSASPEVGVIRTYVDWLVSLPWNVSTDDRLAIKEAAQILDEDHYGLEKVKERILEYLAVRSLAETIRSPILLFVGPPGVGKTSLGRSIAKAMGRKFTRMSLGGIHDEAEIRGHRRTYIGALPGRIIQSIKTAGTNNPVFMLDEVDKIGMDFRGDPSSALLEVLDPEQNFSFQDNYLEVPFDLRKVLFIATANLLDPIPPALRDRMEVIQLPGYTQQEKVEIGRRFLVPKQMDNHGLKSKHVEITDEVLVALVQAYTKEAGVRNLERELANIMRKVARQVAEGRKRKIVVDARRLEEYLGPPRFEYGELEAEDQTGSATGLVVTEVGGDVVAVEVTKMEGKEEFILTGQLGDVMRESARAALSWIRTHAQELGIEREVFEKHTLHIHVPAGATPKDGPSAGVTMATAMVSALTGIPVRKDVAMTGEITLRGRVLPIGGLKSKILAAHLAGAGIVILPRKNEKDLRDIPEDVRKSLKLVPVDTMDQVLEAALRRRPKPLRNVPPTVVEGEPKPAPESRVRRSSFPPSDQPQVVVQGAELPARRTVIAIPVSRPGRAAR